jgi:hypothetical protein
LTHVEVPQLFIVQIVAAMNGFVAQNIAELLQGDAISSLIKIIDVIPNFSILDAIAQGMRPK